MKSWWYSHILGFVFSGGVLPFYRGRSPCFTTIWENMFYFFASIKQANPRISFTGSPLLMTYPQRVLNNQSCHQEYSDMLKRNAMHYDMSKKNMAFFGAVGSEFPFSGARL